MVLLGWTVEVVGGWSVMHLGPQDTTMELGPLGISLLCSINFVLPVIMKNVAFEKSNFYVIFLHESLTPSKIRFLAGPPLKMHFFTDWHLVYSGYSTSTYSTIAWLYKLGPWPIRYELFGQP